MFYCIRSFRIIFFTHKKEIKKGIQSNYVYTRGYRGKVKGLVLDWSGTTADE